MAACELVTLCATYKPDTTCGTYGMEHGHAVNVLVSAVSCVALAGPGMSAAGMLAAVNKARKTALPATADSPGAAEWQLIEAATPLAVTALRAAAASGDRDAVVAALQQQMQPIQPTPLAVQQVGGTSLFVLFTGVMLGQHFHFCMNRSIEV